MKHTVEYELSVGYIIKDGHNMLSKDIVTDLKRKSHLESIIPDLLEALINLLPNYNKYVPIPNGAKEYRAALKAIEKATK